MRSIQLSRKTIVPTTATFILLLLLCMPGIVYFGQQKEFTNLLYALMIPLFIFMVPLFIFWRVIRLYATLIGIFILLAPAVTFPIIYFGLPVKKDILLITFNTTYREASEFLSGYIPLISSVYIVYIVLTILAIKRLPAKISFKKSVIISIFALFSLIGATAAKAGTINILKSIKGLAYNFYPFHLSRAFYIFYKEESIVKQAEKYIKKVNYKNVTHETLPQRQIYVLFIGESARYDHWGLNGYSRQTSPNLSTQQRLLSFNNVAASGILTELSVPQILTGVSADHYMDHVYQPGIMRLFHQAGFKTYWISSQTDYGNIRMHASLADSAIWMQNVFRSNKHVHYDMELINRMKDVLATDTGNCLFVIHPLGSHFNYNYRYPKSFEYFNPVWHSSSVVPTQGNKKSKLINAYDNSILYTDAVLDSTITVLERNNCISAMLYVSDHGENLMDDSRNLVLHAPKNPTKYIAHIPLFIYGSEKYIRYFPLKWKSLEKHINSKISNNQIFETMAGIAGIKYKGESLENNIASPLFKNSSQKILGPGNKVYTYISLK